MRRMEMTEDYSTDHKHNGADQNDDGGFLLGNEWCRFHSQITAALSLSSCVATVVGFSQPLHDKLDIVGLDFTPAFDNGLISILWIALEVFPS
jgi:hypothetical protein